MMAMAHATRPEEHAVRRLVDRVWNDLDAAAAHELIAPECPGLDGTGPEAVLDWHDDRRSAFPDLRYEVDDVVAGSGTRRSGGRSGCRCRPDRHLDRCDVREVRRQGADLRVWSVNDL